MANVYYFTEYFTYVNENFKENKLFFMNTLHANDVYKWINVASVTTQNPSPNKNVGYDGA